MSSTGIFNVEEVTGKDQIALETTAAEARLDAPNRVVARQMEENARKEQESAEQVASVAKTLGSKYTGEPTTSVGQFRGGSDSSNIPKSAAERLQESASKTTNAAVAEGKHDVEEAKAATSTYVQQAKDLANSALETAQAYLPTSIGGKPEDALPSSRTIPGAGSMSAGQSAPGLASQIQTKTVNTYTTAVETAQPHVERAKGLAQVAAEKAQPHIKNAKGVAQGYLGTAGTQGAQLTEKHGVTQVPPASSTGIPVTTAPLESGPHTVTGPYPESTTNTTTEIAPNAVGPPSVRN